MSLEPNAKKARIATSSVENQIGEVKAVVAGVFSDDPSLQLKATIKIRKFLSLDNTPSTVDKVMTSGVVNRLVVFLEKEDSPKLQFEAAWAITNLAVDKPKDVIDRGAVPILVKFLASPNDDVCEQAIWALGNLAARSVENREYLLKFGVLLPLLPHLNVNNKLPMLRIATWTLLNLCRGRPFDQVKPALPTLERLLRSNDEQVLSNACWAVWHITYGSDDGTRSVIEAGFVPRLVQLLQYTSRSVFSPAITIIWILTIKDKQQIQCVINCGVLPVLAYMLTQEYGKRIKKKICWTITNITAGTSEQIQSVIDANLIPSLVDMAHNSELKIKKKAVWAISNATKGGSHDQVKYLVGQSCIKPLCDLLVCPDLRTIYACLNGLEKILKVGEAEKNRGDHVNYYRQLINDAEGKEKIKNLQSHEHNEIKEKAVKILETYWPLRGR